MRFDGNTLVAELTSRGGAKLSFPFDARGELPAAYHEAAAEIREERERGQHWAVLPKVQSALKNPAPDIATAKALLAELDGKEAELPDRSRAKLLRFGEIAEAEGDVATALKLWEQELAIDPNVGIKRRYDTLAKKVR